jgi:hypothetical protein
MCIYVVPRHVFVLLFALDCIYKIPQVFYCTPSIPNYKKFWHFSESHAYRRILVYMFTHFGPYVVHTEISKQLIIQKGGYLFLHDVSLILWIFCVAYSFCVL